MAQSRCAPRVALRYHCRGIRTGANSMQSMKSRWLKLGLAAVGAMAVGVPAAAQRAPEETRAALRVAEGVEAAVFAPQPTVANPCDSDLDRKGRVWSTE